MDIYWTPEKENDAGLEIGMKIGYICNGRKKLDITEILDKIEDVKIVLAEKPIKNLITEILEKDYSD